MRKAEQAERQLIGALMMNPAYTLAVCPEVTKEAFTHPIRGALWKAARDMLAEGRVMDFHLIVDEAFKMLVRVSSKVTREDVEDEALLCQEQLAGLTAIPEYASQVVDAWVSREASYILQESLQELANTDTPASQVLASAISRWAKVEGIRGGMGVTLGEAGKEVLTRAISGMWEDRIPVDLPGNLSSIIPDGLPLGFTLIGARPACGKTAFAVQLAFKLAKSGVPVHFFSLEMSAEEIAARVLASLSQIPLARIRCGDLLMSEKEHLEMAASSMEGVPFIIDDTACLTLSDLVVRSVRSSITQGTKAVFVDYLQLMVPPRAENRQVEVATISRQCKQLAQMRQVAVVGISQLNREAEKGGLPRLADLRESGALEQDADLVLLMSRGEEKDKVTVQVAKNRHGITGTADLQVSWPVFTFR
jgi:replicative DNA helicase